MRAVTSVILSPSAIMVPMGVTDESGQREEKVNMELPGPTDMAREGRGRGAPLHGAPIKEMRALQALALGCPGCGMPDMVKLTKEAIPRSP